MTVTSPDSGMGKPAVTHYRVLERFGYTTLLECVLETGRTHQIRAHMKVMEAPRYCVAREAAPTRLSYRIASSYVPVKPCMPRPWDLSIP